MRYARWLAAALLSVTLIGPAAAQSWPDRAVKVVVPFPAGGSTDVVGRALAQRLTEALGQSFVIENVTGANGNLGAAQVAKAKPDGYTLLFSTSGPAATNKLLYKTLAFDPLKDFTPIGLVSGVSLVIVANPKVAATTLPELIAYAKANPGKLTYGTGGYGAMGNMTGELFKLRAGVDILHVPYRGSALATNDLLAGAVDLCVDLQPTYVPHVAAGTLKAIAVTSEDRAVQWPDVATVAETLPDFRAVAWNGFLGPAGLPADIVQKINAVTTAYATSDDGRSRLAGLGMWPRPSSAAEMAKTMADEVERWRPVVEATKMVLE
jgi:tripartite-type tricarboxylate transporter receptor subunit TctC